MQHEGFTALTFERIDDLRVAARSERGDHQCLGLATGEQCGTVSARQHADLDGDRADRSGIASVDPRLTVEDALTHDVAFQLEQGRIDLVVGPLRAVAAGESGHRLRLDLGEARVALLLLRDDIGLGKSGLSVQCNGTGEVGVVDRGLPGPARFARLGDELLDRADGGLHLLVPEHDGPEHHFLGQPARLGLDHQHRVLGAGHDQVQRRLRELLGSRIQEVLAILPAHARGPDRAVERQAGERQRGGGAEQGRDVGVDLRIERQHDGDDLHVVDEPIGKQRPDRAIDQA